MTSRQRLLAALNHQQPDRVPVDFGSTAVTGIHVSALTRLRHALLGDPNYRAKVIEPYQMLGEIDDDLRNALGIDIAGITPRKTLFGFENKNFKPFTLFDGTPVLVPEHFNTTTDPSGDLLIYPEGDTSAPPSGRMPRGGHFFDSIIRQNPIDDDKLNPADNTEEFGPLADADLSYYQRALDRLAPTDAAIMLTMPGTAFGDIALVPAPWLKHPKGIRDVEEWYISTIARRDYVQKVFEIQCEIALRNIKQLANLFGNRIHATFLTGTDFGTQRGPFISPKTYRNLYKPFHKQVNDLIHALTTWKTFIHSCGSVFQLIPDFIDAGFDILNPVQCSAAQMDPLELKRQFGKDIVFWGGGVDTQHTLPFASPTDVYTQTRRRIEIFNQNGGFVFDSIHNIQATTPTENILAMFNAIRDSAK
jgi:hypothetical protein